MADPQDELDDARDPADVIRESMAELDRLRARRLTDDQLDTIIATFRSSPEASANGRWRDTCIAERDARKDPS